jgi:hypothetical protein
MFIQNTNSKKSNTITKVFVALLAGFACYTAGHALGSQLQSRTSLALTVGHKAAKLHLSTGNPLAGLGIRQFDGNQPPAGIAPFQVRNSTTLPGGSDIVPGSIGGLGGGLIPVDDTPTDAEVTQNEAQEASDEASELEALKQEKLELQTQYRTEIDLKKATMAQYRVDLRAFSDEIIQVRERNNMGIKRASEELNAQYSDMRTKYLEELRMFRERRDQQLALMRDDSNGMLRAMMDRRELIKAAYKQEVLNLRNNRGKGSKTEELRKTVGALRDFNTNVPNAITVGL